MQDDIAHSLAPGMPIHMMTMSWPRPRANVRWSSAWTVPRRPVMRCGSPLISPRCITPPLQVMFCWQLKDLGEVPGYENAIASIGAGQDHAQDIVRRMIEQADIPDGLQVTGKRSTSRRPRA